jgi:hypothetical protein
MKRRPWASTAGAGLQGTQPGGRRRLENPTALLAAREVRCETRAVAETSLALSIVALLVSIVFAVLYYLAVKREESRRIEELAILRLQVGDAEEEREAQRHAELYAEQGGFRSGYREDWVDFRITNGGPAMAREIRIMLMTGNASAGEKVIAPLQPGESIAITIAAAHPVTRSIVPLTLVAFWKDGTGDREQTLLDDVRHD